MEGETSNTIDATSHAVEPSVEHATRPTATDNRAHIARAITSAKDPETLKDLVFLYILEVTRNVAIPGDRWRSIENAVTALRRADPGFARLVREQRECLTRLWQAQGRSHEVWDKLAPLIRKGDWTGVKAEVAKGLAVLAKTSTTIDEVQTYKDNTLLACGLKEPNFRKAVEDAVSEFLTTGPANAASEIARLRESKGPEAAARKLRELTDPQSTTPLQAALILNQAKPTIDILCQALGPMIFQKGFPQQERIFRDLAAAVDSASRSREAAQTIEQVGRALAGEPTVALVTIEDAVKDGNLVLPLEMIKQFRGPSAGRFAGQVSGAVKDGLAGLRARVEQSVLQFAKTVQPLQNPAANWDALLPSAEGQPFKTPKQTAEQWVAAHRDFIPAAEAGLKALNPVAYQMTRAIAALDQYLPQLPQMKNVDEIRKLAEVPANSAVAFAQNFSPDSVIEAARLFNIQGLHGIALEDPNKIVPDPSWPLRSTRNLGQKIGLWRTGAEPFGLGLSLYGTLTYIGGVKNQATELYRNYGDPGWMLRRGWRVLGFMGMYTAGTLIEGAKVAGHIASNWKDLQASQSALGQFTAGAVGNVQGSTWKKFFSNHVKAFGWFNAGGTVWYFIQGDIERGTALGFAAGGTLLSSYASRIGLRILGNGITTAASLVLVGLNLRDQERRRTLTEPFNKDYLITAGLRREIAEQLAKNDSDGLSAGPKLEQLAKHLRVTPQELLQYLNAQDPRWVGEFLSHGVHAVAPNEQGQYPASRPGQNLRMQQGITGWTSPALGTNVSDWRKPELMLATTLEGIVEWAALSGHNLPRR